MTLTAGPTSEVVEHGRALLARDRWSREELETHRRRRLEELIRHPVSASPYYRETLGPNAADAPLEQLPTLSKATLMEQFDRIVTDPQLTLASVDAQIAGANPGALLLDDYHVFSTSGTTGRRGVFVQTRDEFAVWLAAGWRVLLRNGAEPGMRVAGIPAPTPLHITRKLFAGLGGDVGVSVTTPMLELVGALNRIRPDVILTTAGLGGLLAEEQLQGRLGVEPAHVLVSGEVLTDDAKLRIHDAWGTVPREVYASTEALFLASASPCSAALLVADDLVVLEIVDEQNRPVPAGVPGQKVLLTNLVNRALPLVRYEISDVVTLAPGSGSDGRTYIERVDGRSDDVFRLPARDGGETAVMPYRLRAPFARLADVLQYHVVYDGERIDVRVVVRSGAPAEILDRVADGVRSACDEAGAVAPPIGVESVSTIERTNAKHRVIEFRPEGRST
jgi:phenylacetate-coenzyme A ligase PaaK-like adenylate-forming protein